MGFLDGIFGKKKYLEERKVVDAIKSAERSKRASRFGEYVESILDSVPDIILIVDSENAVIKSNDSARKALGIGKDDISGMRLNSVADIDTEKALHGSVPGTIKSPSGMIPTVFWAKRITDMQGEQCTIIVAKDDSVMASELKKKVDDLNSSYAQLFGYKEMM